MPEVNFAEVEARMRDNPSLEDCRQMGQTHKSYGWSPRPWGHWCDERKAAYHEGFEGKP